MVLSERRHRLNMIEVNPVMEAVRDELLKMLKKKEYPLKAEILFRVWYRLEKHPHGRPDYPPFSWATLKASLQPKRTVPFMEVPARGV